MKLTPVANFIKLFGHNLHHYQRIAFSFDSGYDVRGVNYAKISFMKLTIVANFINFYQHNLHHYQCIALSFDSGYAARGINYAKISL
jgi:hypothetical protein